MEHATKLYKINRNSKLPLYGLIEQNFRELIIGGFLKHGDPIPSEWELADLYSVSRLTVRHALGVLTRQGWLKRRHGVGTFVSNPTVATIASSKLSFTEQMHAIGRIPSSKQIRIQILPATEETAHHLGLQDGDLVIEITRVRLADGEPILLETSYLSQKRFPNLDDRIDLTNSSLYEFLSNTYQTNIAKMDQTLEPVLLTESEAGYLDTQPGTPALLSEIIAYSTMGEPIEYCWSVTRGDKCKFYFRFRRGETTSSS